MRNVITGDDFANDYVGTWSSDRIFGMGGDDTLKSSTARSNDTLYGGDGNDRLYATAAPTLASGDAGNDQIYAGRQALMVAPAMIV